MFKGIKVEAHRGEMAKPRHFSTIIEIPDGTTSTGLTEIIKNHVVTVTGQQVSEITVKIGKEDIKPDWSFSMSDQITAKIK
jgi:hypothetical protein